MSSFESLVYILFFIIKIPYYLIKAFYYILFFIIKTIKRISRLFRVEKELKRVERTNAKYQKLEIVKKEQGDLKKWENSFYLAESRIGIILGARGSGKTAIGIKLMENAYTSSDKKCYAIGFQEKEMPSWIKVISNIQEIENDSLVLIDEGGVLFSSRGSMTAANKMLSSLILVSRHKNISILFISQNSSNLDVNIIRQADFLILKPSSLLQKDFERKIISKLYEDLAGEFSKLKSVLGLTYIYSDGFRGFVKNSLPSFWKTSISKSFR